MFVVHFDESTINLVIIGLFIHNSFVFVQMSELHELCTRVGPHINIRCCNWVVYRLLICHSYNAQEQ